MRITICELPHEPCTFGRAWSALCEHTRAQSPQLVLLPELAMVAPVWEFERFDIARWSEVELLAELQLSRLAELGAEHVVGTRPVRVDGRCLNQAYLWSASTGLRALRSKYFLPEEPGSWEATWFDAGDADFPVYRAGAAAFGVNICTELWALETYASYASLGADLVLTPRATAVTTATKWMAAGMVAAVRAGAFSVSSNRVDPTGACGGGGWIIDSAGEVLAITSAARPFATRDIDLLESARAKSSYPRYVFPASAPLQRLGSLMR